MLSYYKINNLCHPYKRVHVIKHVYSSTTYGIRKHITNQPFDTSFVVCFENKKDVNHVMRSIATHKAVFNDNPNESLVCVYNKNELIDIDDLNYGLYTSEIYLTDLLDEIFNRNMGLFLINDIYNDYNDSLSLRSIQIYPTQPLKWTVTKIEEDFLL